jgi:indole-3-glycerol phosphate synthase
VTTILDQIVATKRQEVERLRWERPERELRAALRDAPPVRDFLAPLAAPGPIRLIAEIKKASPSKGVLRADFQPLEIADTYAANGATCLSVLTDRPFFQGGLDILQAVRQRVALPLLRKDFVLDPYQVLEARLAGADAVLLIAECLSDSDLPRLAEAVRQLQMTPLVELYEPRHLDRVLALGTRLIGINNRDLRNFTTDLDHTIRLRREIPADRVVVGESGIRCRADAQRWEQAGVQAMLVGEALMAAPDLGHAVRSLVGAADLA